MVQNKAIEEALPSMTTAAGGPKTTEQQNADVHMKMQSVVVDWWWMRIHSMELNRSQLIATFHTPSRTGVALAPLVLWGWLMDGLMDWLIADGGWGGEERHPGTNPHSADRSGFSSWYSGIFLLLLSEFPSSQMRELPISLHIIYYWILYPQNILLCFQKKNMLRWH